VTDVLMPRLSDSMEQGTILTWLVQDGGEVAEGQELAEIETDKATMTYEAEAAGTLAVVAAEGTTVAVGEVIARVGGDGEPAAARGEPQAAANEESEDVAAQASPAAEAVPAAAVAEPVPSNGSAGHKTTALPAFDAQHPATPMARRIAALHDVSLGSLQGSGPRGRIVRADVLRAAGIEEAAPAAGKVGPPQKDKGSPAGARPQPADGPQPPAPPPLEGDTHVEPTRLQALIARRMAESKATIPHFQVQTEVEMTAALAFRQELKALLAARDAPAPSFNDLIVKASALALRRFPRANGSYVDGRFVLHGAVNVGIAVAGDDALVVPVLHGADGLTLGEIAARTRELAAAVRDGTVTPPQLSGGTFTVSNLGMYGMSAITPVVNPPQAAILGVGAIRDVLARDESGEIIDRRLLTLTLSCDHRILYGADAARFLGAIRGLLQQPAGLAL
jgi:pyruvate dehydrogenase E2 component (dihydrolipoamide acetyltransferase)